MTTTIMPLSTRTKWEIVFLATHRHGPHMTPKQISKEVRCTVNTVKFWLKRFKDNGDVEELPRAGRPRKTTEEQDEVILAAQEEDREATMQDIQQEVKKQRIEVSSSTIRRRVMEAGMRFIPPLVKPLLSIQYIEKRVEWANQYGEQDWKQVMFSDESTIRLHYYRRSVWRRPGEHIVRRSVKHPAKVNIWGCLSSQGFGKAYVFTGNMDAKLLCKIYKKALLPSAEKLFEGEWKLQEDNDPKHRSRLAAKWREDNQVEKINWPSQSPDLNCIENVWRLLKIRVADRRPQNIQELIQVTRQEWRKLPTSLAVNLVNSMPRRLDATLAANGDYTMY